MTTSPKTYKVMSWNVNSVNARLERVEALLDRHQPDILCLQELKCQADRFPIESFQKRGYQCEVLGQKTYNGVAVCSRAPIDAKSIPLSATPFSSEARAVGVQVSGIWFYSLYIPNGQEVSSPKYAYKLSWLKALEEFLVTTHSSDERVVLCGDFNIAPHSIDVYDPSVWEGRVLFTQPERDWLTGLLKSYQDTFRIHHPAGSAYSWWDYRELGFPLNKGLRIDLVLASAPMAKNCSHAAIDRDERKGVKPSDHAPVMATFTLGPLGLAQE